MDDIQRDAAYYFKRADERVRADDVEGAVGDLDQAICLDPENVHYYWKRALLRYQHNEHRLAVEDLTRIIQLTSDRDELESAYSTRALSYENLELYHELVADLTWLIDHGFGTDTAYAWRGHHLHQQGHFEAAIRDFTAAFELSPETEDFLLQRAHAYYQAGRYDEAIYDLTHILGSPDHHPNYLIAIYHWRGLAYYHLGQESDALADFSEEMRLRGRSACSSVDEYFKVSGADG